MFGVVIDDVCCLFLRIVSYKAERKEFLQEILGNPQTLPFKGLTVETGLDLSIRAMDWFGYDI
jgi:hypothetical protein